VSNLTDEDKRRIRELCFAARTGALGKLPEVVRNDIALLVKRIDDLDDKHESAESMVQWIERRLVDEVERTSAWLADSLDQVRIAELCVMEAKHSLEAVRALVAGGMYASGDEIIKRWDAVEEDFKRRGLIAPDPEPAALPAEEPPPAVAEAEPEPEPQPVEPLPPALVAQLSKAGQAEHAPVSTPEPIGTLSWTQPGDPMTEKQANVFRAILSAADADWRSQISQGRIAKVAGEKPGGMWAHLEALERKDYIRILDRGNSATPGVYLICERARPERPAAPKTDAELIAEALEAGKVTVCPPAHVH
jgi:hypothetical protein